MNKVTKILLIIVGVILVIALILGAIAAYFGVIPGLSGLFGANKPRDLGVRYSQADFTSYLTKTNTQIFDYSAAPVPPTRPTDTIIYTDPEPKNVTISDAEMSARVSYSKWENLPLKNVQIKAGDGTVEISGTVITSRLKSFAQIAVADQYSSSDIDAALGWLGLAGDNPAVYLKTKAIVKNNVVDIQVQSAQLNRLSLPIGLTNDAVTATTKSILGKVTGLSIDSAVFSTTGLHFEGIAPTKDYVKQVK